MVNRLIINDIDIFTNFGIFIIEDGYGELVQYPALKKIITNDWAEEDGTEPDLTAPVLDSRSMTLNFAVVNRSYEAIKSFTSFLTESVYNIFNFNDIGYTFKLRLTSQGSLEMYDNLGFFSLEFADDFPLNDYCYIEPNGCGDYQSISLSYSYTDNGESITVKNDLSVYGISVINNSLNSINELADIKERLSRDLTTHSGLIYDSDSRICFDSRKLSLDCLILSDTNSNFWLNYNALLYDLSRIDGNTLYTSDAEYPCYYYSSTLSEFISDDKGVWCKFTINLVLY